MLRFLGYAVAVVAALILVGSTMVVIDPGEVGVRRAFGYVDPQPLLSGIRFVPPWSEIERYSTREEQWPPQGERVETIDALSSEQMAMRIDVSIRWQIDPIQAPMIFTEIGKEDQIRGAVLNAIRKGVRDGMVQFSINDISKRTQIATTMERLVDSSPHHDAALWAPARSDRDRPAFFLAGSAPRSGGAGDHNKIAQEQQIETSATASKWPAPDGAAAPSSTRRVARSVPSNGSRRSTT